jgi:hypothetical protein
MAQIFHRSTNTISRVSVFGAVFFIAWLGWLFDALNRSPYTTQQGVARVQPVQFSHQHHVGAMGLDCRYCHTSVERAAFANVPPTKTCMNCHAQIWNQSPELEPVRESWRTGQSIEWVKVYDLPDYVYFNHSIHVAKGVGCETCHGRIDRMPQRLQAANLQMSLVPGLPPGAQKHLRRATGLHDGLRARGDQEEIGERLKAEYHIRPTFELTDCTTCHR